MHRITRPMAPAERRMFREGGWYEDVHKAVTSVMEELDENG